MTLREFLHEFLHDLRRAGWRWWLAFAALEVFASCGLWLHLFGVLR